MQQRLRFTPHVQHPMRPYQTAFLVALAVMLGGSALALHSLLERYPSMQAAVVQSRVLDATNAERALQGLHALTVSDPLQAAAQQKAEDMAQRGYFAHTSPEGTTPWYWFSHVGYSFSYAGENLAVRFTNSEAVVHAWMNSAPHRTTILLPEFTETGVGIARGMYKGHEATFVVQLFAQPARTSAGDTSANGS